MEATKRKSQAKGVLNSSLIIAVPTVVPSQRLSLDHVNAESKGGMDSWRNLVPACGKCNLSKGSLNLRDWYSLAAFLLEERLQRILNRCGIKIWAKPPLGEFEPLFVTAVQSQNESASSITHNKMMLVSITHFNYSSEHKVKVMV